METLILSLLALTAVFAVVFGYLTFKLTKRIKEIETHLDVQAAHVQVMNDVFQKSITIIKDALVDFDNRINMNRNIIMASVDSNKINAETRLTNLETAEKNNNIILQNDIRSTRALVDKINEDIKFVRKITEDIQDMDDAVSLKNKIDEILKMSKEINKIYDLKNKFESYLLDALKLMHHIKK